MSGACPRCGWTADADDRFCGRCGSTLLRDRPAAATPAVRPVSRLGRWVDPLYTSTTDPLRTRQAVLVAVVGTLLFLVALIFMTANSAEAQACITESNSSFDLIQSTNACDSAYDAWRSGQRLLPIGIVGLVAAVVIGVGRGGLLAVLAALGADGRR